MKHGTEHQADPTVEHYERLLREFCSGDESALYELRVLAAILKLRGVGHE